MAEIWEHPFGYASLKIERAKDHISNIEKRLLSSPNHYGPRLYVDAQTGKQFLHYSLTDRTLTQEISLTVGDAIHNLHSALDIAWCATYCALVSSADSKFRKFPVYPKEERRNFESKMRGKMPSSSALFDFIVNRVKPYKGGDTDITSLHELDIDDKHRLLIPMLTVTSLDGVELQHEDGRIERLDITLIRPNFYRKMVPLETEIKHHGKARFRITFREGDFLQGEEVIPTLLRFTAKANRIVRILQRMK